MSLHQWKPCFAHEAELRTRIRKVDGPSPVTAIYRIIKLYAAHRGGMNAAVDADVRGIAKTNDESPFTIANEIIAARVGQTLGLPIPAGIIAEDSSKRLYYLSLDVSREQKQLPPIIPSAFASAEPRLAAGVVVFDVLIANGDRNGSNLSLDPAFSPPRASVFDHGHALLGTNPPTGKDRLALATDRLGCVDDDGRIASDSVLCDQPLDCDHLREWTDRVSSIPSYVFDDACAEVAKTPGLNVAPELAAELAKWLAERAANTRRLIWDNQGFFTAIRWDLWGVEGQS
jgi:hypothetical protein